MLDGGSRFGLGRSVRNRRVFFENLLMSVECVRFFGTLGEGFVLQLRVVVLSLGRCEVLRSVVVVLHVGDCAAKGDLFTVLTLFDRVRPDVRWHCDDFSGVLVAAVVLLNVDIIGHVLVARSIDSLLYVSLRPEWLLIAICNLGRPVLHSTNRVRRLDVWVTEGRVTWLAEQDLVDSCTLLHRVRSDVRRVDQHFLWVFAILVDARYESGIVSVRKPL